jgi:2-isopropylmalate synthase
MPIADLIYDWNTLDGAPARPPAPIEFDDETLRDGLQSPSVRNPSIDQKVRILHLMESLGIDCADIGLPGAGPVAREHVRTLAREIARNRMRILPDCACRTLITDIQPVVEVSQEVGIPIEVSAFIGSSPIRQYAEDWTLDQMLRNTETAVSFAVSHGLPVMYVTEDTTRARPETIEQLYLTAIRAGARRICVADTVGHATPNGVVALLRHIRAIVATSGEDVKVDFHGHQDRGLGVINAITAVLSGADRVHGTALGIGERVGNAQLDQILVNLKMMGLIDNDLTHLAEYVRTVSEAVGVPIPKGYPVVGRDAFRTATGVHASAVIKAYDKGDREVADMVYSAVPAHMFGLSQVIEIGPMSGAANVSFWLRSRGISPDKPLIDAILKRAKEAHSVLSDEEAMEVVQAHTHARS